MRGKIIIAIIALVVIAGLVYAGVMFVASLNAENTPPENTGTTSSQPANQDSQEGQNRPSDNGDSMDSGQGTGSDGEPQQETQITGEAQVALAENEAMSFMDSARASEPLNHLSRDIPALFDVPTNLIDSVLANGNLRAYSPYEAYTQPEVKTHVSFDVGDSRYTRHAMTVISRSSGGTGPQGERLEAGRPITHYVDEVIDGSTGELVYFGQAAAQPVHVPMVEAQYPQIREAIGKNGGDASLDVQGIRARLLAIYSYSYYIESDYQETVSALMDYSGVSEGMDSGNVVKAMMTNWRPVKDGGGMRVASLGTPVKISLGSGYSIYSCPITYRIDHDNPAVKDREITTVLKFALSDGGKFLSLQEDEDETVEGTVDARFHDDADVEYNPTIEMLLQPASEEGTG